MFAVQFQLESLFKFFIGTNLELIGLVLYHTEAIYWSSLVKKVMDSAVRF